MVGHDKAVTSGLAYACLEDTKSIRDERVLVDDEAANTRGSIRDPAKGVQLVLELDSEIA